MASTVVHRDKAKRSLAPSEPICGVSGRECGLSFGPFFGRRLPACSRPRLLLSRFLFLDGRTEYASVGAITRPRSECRQMRPPCVMDYFPIAVYALRCPPLSVAPLLLALFLVSHRLSLAKGAPKNRKERWSRTKAVARATAIVPTTTRRWPAPVKVVDLSFDDCTQRNSNQPYTRQTKHR